MTIVEFLNARLADPVGHGDPDLNCFGVGEYYRCDEWSEWHRRTVEAQRAIIATEMDRVGHPREFITPEMADQIRGRADSQVLRALASVHADHPDYNSDWKP